MEIFGSKPLPREIFESLSAEIRKAALVRLYGHGVDAPDGEAYYCPDCDSVATLSGNAAFHASTSGHQLPFLGPWSPEIGEVEFLRREKDRLQRLLVEARQYETRMHIEISLLKEDLARPCDCGGKNASSV